jgi:hypothetical protein
MFIKKDYFGTISNPVDIATRLKQKPALGEVIGFSLALGMLLGFLIVNPPSIGFDLKNYLKTSDGDFSNYYYGYWLLPIFTILRQLPFTLSYLFWGLLSIFSILFALRVFGGWSFAVLSSYQMFYILYQGQFIGPGIGALALLWWGLVNRRWNIAGLGLILAAAKYQTGFTCGLILLICAPISWYERTRVLIIPGLVILLSLVAYPMWPLRALETLRYSPPNDLGSMTLWRWIGPYALLFWLPILATLIRRQISPIAWIATVMLSAPYFQQTDLLVLFVLPVSWLPILGNFGYLGGYKGLQALVILPLLVYIEFLFGFVKTRTIKLPLSG